MMRIIRIFMFLEALSFAVASLVHSGVLIGGYEQATHRSVDPDRTT